MDCPFCANSRTPQATRDLVWTFPHSMAILGRWQFFRGYCVLFSRAHAHEPTDLPAKERDGLMSDMWWLARAIAQVTRARKINYELLGNQVEHPHWHLFPRLASDPEHLKPAWVRIDREEGDPKFLPALEGPSGDRPAAIAELQAALKGLGAPTA